ncbi:hypothetical protein B2K11_09570 [Microbacterium sp. B35-30]|nr:hypothetical protein B2K11_09570 [Microbacterium sp. B35-30]
MSQKLTIVVTCTDRKSLSVPEQRMLRSLPGSPPAVSTWTQRIDSAVRVVPLRTLYQGDAWSQLPRLEEASRVAGFEPTTYVASAGLGLRPVSSVAPAYGATFTPNQPDSIRGSVEQQRVWWDGLNEWNGSRGEVPEGNPTLFVLSQRYADVLAPLVAKSAVASSVLVIGGSNAVAPSLRLPADARLRSAVGGTLGALNMRTAVAWMERLTEPAIDSPRARASWNTWAEGARRDEQYRRTPLGDDEVLEAVRLIRTEQPAISRTRALRMLRDNGFACEQKRFAHLFESARGGAS